MKNQFLFVAMAFIAFCFASCGSAEITIKQFDHKAWRADTNGCNGSRLGMANTLISQKDALMRHNQNEIEAYLGKPDEHELYERSRKYFFYYLEPNTKCNNTSTAQYPARLSIRFNAMGFANEILIMR